MSNVFLLTSMPTIISFMRFSLPCKCGLILPMRLFGMYSLRQMRIKLSNGIKTKGVTISHPSPDVPPGGHPLSIYLFYCYYYNSFFPLVNPCFNIQGGKGVSRKVLILLYIILFFQRFFNICFSKHHKLQFSIKKNISFF